MPPDLTLDVHDDPPADLAQALEDGLEAHNHAAAPIGDVRPLAAFARDRNGALVGGASGRTWGGCCELLELWVAPSHRGAGLATRLLQAFERHAGSRGCTVFYLTTLSYQAPDFYRRHGYEALAEIAGYPRGIVKYLMHKSVDVAD